MDYCQTEDPTIRDYCEWQRSSWCMDEILTMDETFSEEEVTLMGRYEPYNDVGDTQNDQTNKEALLEEALSSIGMRQLLPQISISHSSDITEELRQLHYPSLGSSEAHMQYFNSGASVFVPVSNTPAQVAIKTELCLGKGKHTEPLRTCHSVVSSMGSWHSSSEACVPDLSPRAPLSTPRNSARVPDYFCSGFAPDPDSPHAQVQAAVLCNTRQLRPRMHIKAEDDFASSDDDKRIASYESLDDMPRIVPDSVCSLNRSECLQRYRDKKQRRHFTHKVRYTARKLNADRRPRIKGRFVKACDLTAAAAGEV